MTRADLIAALEKAEGPSRELDLRIQLAISNPLIMTDPGGYGPNGRKPSYTPAREIWTDDWPYWSERTQVEGACHETGAHPYTASLDAALSLVPEGHAWLFKSFGVATVYKIPPSDDDETWPIHHDAKGATSAIALVIAALRAMD